MSFLEYLIFYGFSFLFLLNIYLTLFLRVRRGRAFADKFARAAFLVGLAATVIACVNLPFALSNAGLASRFSFISYFTALLNAISLAIQLIYCFDKGGKGEKKC